MFRRGYQRIKPVPASADLYSDERAPRFPLPLHFYVPQNQTWGPGMARAPSPCSVHGGWQQDGQAGSMVCGVAQPPARVRCSLGGSDRVVLADSWQWWQLPSSSVRRCRRLFEQASVFMYLVTSAAASICFHAASVRRHLISAAALPSSLFPSWMRNPKSLRAWQPQGVAEFG